MNAPFYQLDGFGYPTAMALATILGIGFGFALERSGFGRATVLAAQFYGRDMRVLKVMFSAIATAAVGLGLLSGIGLLNLAALEIPETWILPQTIGGLLLGMGFIVSGYCPGTAVVATASGNVDGLVSLLGVMVGSVLFGFVFPLIEGFYESTAMGSVTLPGASGVPWAAVALGVVLLAAGAFVAAEKVERLLASKDRQEPPAGAIATRNRVLSGLAAAASLAIVALALPRTGATEAGPTPTPTPIDAVTLGTMLSGKAHEVYLVDLRLAAECERERIPGAMCIPTSDVDAAFLATLPPTRPLVVYGGEPETPLPSGVQAWGGELRVLDGGFAAWKAQVLTAPSPPENPTAEELAKYRTRAALHVHFTGASAPAPAEDFKPKAVTRSVKKGGGC